MGGAWIKRHSKGSPLGGRFAPDTQGKRPPTIQRFVSAQRLKKCKQCKSEFEPKGSEVLCQDCQPSQVALLHQKTKERRLARQAVESPDSLTTAEQIAHWESLLNEIDETRERAASEGDEFGAGDPWPVFARKMRVLTPQSAGRKMEKWLVRAYGWTGVSSTENRGDALHRDGKYSEVKVTFITSSNKNANFVQLRPYQGTDMYDLFVVDSNYRVIHLRVSKADMLKEIEKIGKNAHGTGESASENTNREFSIRFPWTPEKSNSIAARWLSAYKMPKARSGHPLHGHTV